ncbi:MAG: hypothetical protein M1482_08350, partial [Chloroflexi bacterium]|nr:hypothetical protein [Chloroflexota bacterium]
MPKRASFSISQALFSAVVLFLVLTLLNGYLQNIVAGGRANAWIVLAGDVIALALVLWYSRSRVHLDLDPLELAGFLIVTVGTWLYFVAPSLPTLLPPTQSSDAVRVYQQVLFSYPAGSLVTWYPAAGAFLAAVFSHWLGWAPLRVLHPTAALFVALAAGATYGITCSLLPKRRVHKIAALLAPALLFAPWTYFAGVIDWDQYFYAQAFAQLFVLAALWYTASYAERQDWVYAALVSASLIGVVAAYPVFVVLPFAAFALVVVVRVLVTAKSKGGTQRAREGPAEPEGSSEAPGSRAALATLGLLVALLLVVAFTLQLSGILDISAARVPTTAEVGPGGVAKPTLENLGGPFFLLLGLVGIPLAWKGRAFGKALVGFVVVWLLQFAAIAVVQSFVPISDYRVNKTFYILIFPLAIFAALTLIRIGARAVPRMAFAPRALAAGFVGVVLLLAAAILAFSPPKPYAPFTESQLQTAFWAKGHLDTYQISYMDPQTIRAYWLAFGLWGETLPNEWFQWIPAGTKLGPASFDDWLQDSAWPRWAFVPDVDAQPVVPAQVLYQNGTSAIVQKAEPEIVKPVPQHASQWVFASALGQTIRLLGYDMPRTTFLAGETVTFTTYAESIYPPQVTAGWRAAIVDRDDNVVSGVSADPFAGRYPVQRWPMGRFSTEHWALPLEPNLPPGRYQVQLGLYGRVDGREFSPFYTDSSGAALPDKKPPFAVPLAVIKIPVARPT